MVAAAADLQLAFREVGGAFAEKTGHRVTFTFGSTGNLAKQIENGAPVDVFAAADTSFIDGLKMKGLVAAGSDKVYGIGRLVLASNGFGMNVKRPEDLLRPEIKRIAIANPDHAPYGKAAKEVLVRLDIWTTLQPRIVFGENVQQALQFVQTGNAEAGFVALSIANVPNVALIYVDEGLHAPLRQSMAVIQGTRNESVAREFVAFVGSAEGQGLMRKYGFGPPEE